MMDLNIQGVYVIITVVLIGQIFAVINLVIIFMWVTLLHKVVVNVHFFIYHTFSLHKLSIFFLFQLSNRILITNVLKLHKIRKFVCEMCGVEYRTFKRITYHLPRCAPGPYPCNVCTLLFATQKELNYHKRKMHKYALALILYYWKKIFE